jgi:hypothetical protein
MLAYKMVYLTLHNKSTSQFLCQGFPVAFTCCYYYYFPAQADMLHRY